MNETNGQKKLIEELHKWRPAYPAAVNLDGGGTLIEMGVSTLDYFAAQAMQGILAHQFSKMVANVPENLRYEMLATDAYVIAEKMMEEREKFYPKQEP